MGVKIKSKNTEDSLQKVRHYRIWYTMHMTKVKPFQCATSVIASSVDAAIAMVVKLERGDKKAGDSGQVLTLNRILVSDSEIENVDVPPKMSCGVPING